MYFYNKLPSFVSFRRAWKCRVCPQEIMLQPNKLIANLRD